MERRASPFAALTGAEKQLKWLEYQSIRLPYVNESMDALPEEPSRRAEAKVTMPKSAEARELPPKEPHAQANQRTAVNSDLHHPSPETTSTSARPAQAPSVEFQKTRHRQYDAVIEKMRQAELRARQYQPLR